MPDPSQIQKYLQGFCSRHKVDYKRVSNSVEEYRYFGHQNTFPNPHATKVIKERPVQPISDFKGWNMNGDNVKVMEEPRSAPLPFNKLEAKRPEVIESKIEKSINISYWSVKSKKEKKEQVVFDSFLEQSFTAELEFLRKLEEEDEKRFK